MQNWKIIGVGLLISVLVRGCPDTEKQSTHVAEKQSIQVVTLPSSSSLLKTPNIAPPPKGVKDSSSSSPIAKSLTTDSENVQSPVSTIPSAARELELSSPVIQQESGTNFHTSHVQANFPADGEGIQDSSSSSAIAKSLTAGSENVQYPVSTIPSATTELEPSSPVTQQRSEANYSSCVQADVPADGEGIQDSSSSPIAKSVATDSENVQYPVSTIPSTATELEPSSPVIQQRSEANYSSCVQANVSADSGTSHTSSNEGNVAHNQRLFPRPIVLTSSDSSSGRCNYSWEFDSAGNLCGDRAASERPNLSTGNSVGSYYSSPISGYSVPSSSYGSTYVRGYFRRDGTYVRGHYRRSR